MSFCSATSRDCFQITISIFVGRVVLAQQVRIHKIAFHLVIMLVDFISLIIIIAASMAWSSLLLLFEITFEEQFAHVFTRNETIIEADLVKVEATAAEAFLARALHAHLVVVHLTFDEAVVAASVLELAHVKGTANVNDITELGCERVVGMATGRVHMALITVRGQTRSGSGKGGRVYTLEAATVAG